jgi:hypothetical protein
MKPTHQIQTRTRRRPVIARVTIPEIPASLGAEPPKPDRVKWVFLALLIATLVLFGVHARISHRTAVERDAMEKELIEALEESNAVLEKVARPPAHRIDPRSII